MHWFTSDIKSKATQCHVPILFLFPVLLKYPALKMDEIETMLVYRGRCFWTPFLNTYRMLKKYLISHGNKIYLTNTETWQISQIEGKSMQFYICCILDTKRNQINSYDSRMLTVNMFGAEDVTHYDKNKSHQLEDTSNES